MIVQVPTQTASGKVSPPNGYLWDILSVRILMTAITTTDEQNVYVFRGSNFGTDILAYVPNQTSAGTILGQGSHSNYSDANYLVTFLSKFIITYSDGIGISVNLPTGASAEVYILVNEYPEESQ